MRKLIFALVLLAFACAEDPEPRTISRIPTPPKKSDINGIRACPDFINWKVNVQPSTIPDPLEDDWGTVLVQAYSPIPNYYTGWGATAAVMTFEVKNEGLTTLKYRRFALKDTWITVAPGQTITFTINTTARPCGQTALNFSFPFRVRRVDCGVMCGTATRWEYSVRAISVSNFHTIDPASSQWGATHIYQAGQCTPC